MRSHLQTNICLLNDWIVIFFLPLIDLFHLMTCMGDLFQLLKWYVCMAWTLWSGRAVGFSVGLSTRQSCACVERVDEVLVQPTIVHS